jgi:hypothetical protein
MFLNPLLVFTDRTYLTVELFLRGGCKKVAPFQKKKFFSLTEPAITGIAPANKIQTTCSALRKKWRAYKLDCFAASGSQ